MAAPSSPTIVIPSTETSILAASAGASVLASGDALASGDVLGEELGSLVAGGELGAVHAVSDSANAEMHARISPDRFMASD
jgi:hypothetical protein